MIQVTNRLKGLDLIDRVPEELWMEVHNTVQDTGIKTILKKKKCKTIQPSHPVFLPGESQRWGSLVG